MMIEVVGTDEDIENNGNGSETTLQQFDCSAHTSSLQQQL